MNISFHTPLQFTSQFHCIYFILHWHFQATFENRVSQLFVTLFLKLRWSLSPPALAVGNSQEVYVLRRDILVLGRIFLPLFATYINIVYGQGRVPSLASFVSIDVCFASSLLYAGSRGWGVGCSSLSFFFFFGLLRVSTLGTMLTFLCLFLVGWLS